MGVSENPVTHIAHGPREYSRKLSDFNTYKLISRARVIINSCSYCITTDAVYLKGNFVV